MPDPPPPYGFRPDLGGMPSYMANAAQMHPNPASLSYSMPMPMPPPQSQSTNETLEPPQVSAPRASFGDNYDELFGYAWQFVTSEDPFPHNKAVRAGRDCDGSTIYVGRAFHEGDLLPAKVIPDRDTAYISYEGEEIEKDEYEILRFGDFVWEFATNGEVPDGAVPIGRTANGETLYMGRCLHEGSQTPGKIHPSHGCLYIPFGGDEISVREYEVLVIK